jgi:hypothetical protein
MAECERTLASSADRILRLVEEETRAYIIDRSKLLDSAIHESRRGMDVATVLALIALLGAIGLIAGGFPTGTALLSVPVVILVRGFPAPGPVGQTQPSERRRVGLTRRRQPRGPDRLLRTAPRGVAVQPQSSREFTDRFADLS